MSTSEMSTKRHWKRNYFTILIGQTFSQVSSGALQMAIVFYLTLKTGSSMVLSMATMMGFLPQAVLRNYFTILIGQTFSQVSSGALQMAIVFYLTLKTGSSMVLSMATMMGFLPQAVLGPFIGTLIDRLINGYDDGIFTTGCFRPFYRNFNRPTQ